MPKPKWHDFGNRTYALTGGSNIGYIAPRERALMVDAGLDRNTARKALRQFEALGAGLAGVVLTHGHADHFGGAPWAARHHSVPVYAPPLEGVYAHQPLLEPIFLHGGAAPIAELQGKFTLGRDAMAEMPRPLEPGPAEIEGIHVDVVPLPGHAPAQVGIGYPAATAPAPDGRSLFCGDAVFPLATIDRHPILFCYDVDAWLATLEGLAELPYDRFVPGHGMPCTNIAPMVVATAARLREIREVTRRAIVTPRGPYDILETVATHFAVTFAAPQFLLLSLTTINAALTSLQAAGEAEVAVEHNRLLWRAL